MIQHILTAVAGLGGIAGVTSLLQVRPNARKLRADAAAVLTDSSGRLLTDALRRIERLEQQLDEQDRQKHAQDRRLLRHERWDIAIAEQVRELGGSVADPPPLFHDVA